ncbi:MAG: hypothetical protein IKP88_08010 [Lachnospiraceae bacterium]|nr:hypothetical protein [Lachnospiraceae bacterium]
MIDKMEKKFGKYAIPGLMKYIIMLYIIGTVIGMINESFYEEWLMLDIDKVLEGQVWRILTFIIQPVNPDNIFSTILSLYVYFFLGLSLEKIWGTFRFNLYYISGILFNILAVVGIYLFTLAVIGYGVPYAVSFRYLNLTLFLGFALTLPEMRFGMFGSQTSTGMIISVIYVLAVTVDVVHAFSYGTETGIITLITSGVWIVLLCLRPKAQSLAIIYAVLLGVDIYQAFRSSWIYGVVILIAIVASMLNFLILYISLKKKGIGYKNPYRKQFMESIKRANAQRAAESHPRADRENAKVIVLRPAGNVSRHKCAVCGRTEKDDESLEFRFCSKCNGNYEYCSDHLYTHKHIE